MTIAITAKLRVMTALSSSLVLFAAAQAAAQETDDEGLETAGQSPAATSSAVSSPDTEAGEIIVTARRREETLQDVPVVITAFTGEDLDRYGISSLNDVAVMTPGLVIANTHNNVGGSMTIRGIGATTQNSAIDQAVSVNVDGVQVSQGNILRMGQYDLERIEILKGPQSLFFGKNSTAGIISLTSRGPGDVLEGHVQGGYEFAQQQTYGEAAVSVPLADGLGARVFVYASDQKGWFRNSAAQGEVPGIWQRSDVKSSPNETEFFVRGTLAYKAPGGGFDAELKLSHNKVDRDNGPAGLSQKFDCPRGFSQASAEALTGGTASDVDECKIDRLFVSADPLPRLVAFNPLVRPSAFSEYRQSLASLEANVDLSPALRLTSVSGYYKFDQLYSDMYTNTNASILASTSDYASEQFTQELRLASDFDGPLNFMVGGFYQDAKLEDAITVTLDVVVPAPVLLTDVTYRQKTDSKSVFGEATFELSDTFDVSAGLRYTKEEKQLSGDNRGNPLVVSVMLNEYSNTSAQATARWQPSDDLTAFASYREGFIAGGFDFNPAPPGFGPNVDISFRESTARGFEVGVKGRAGSSGLSYDVAAFRYKYYDMQLAARDAVTLSSTTLNAGAATVKGIEANLQLRVPSINALRLSLQGAYIDARYDEFIASCYTGQSIAEGCSLRPNAAGAFTSQDLAGERLVRSPEWTGTVGALYDLAVSPTLDSNFSVSASYSSSFEATTENDLRARHPSYWILNASVTLKSVAGWSLAVLGRNLTQELIRPNAFHSPLSGGGTGTNNPTRADLFGIVGDPREVAVQLRYEF